MTDATMTISDALHSSFAGMLEGAIVWFCALHYGRGLAHIPASPVSLRNAMTLILAYSVVAVGCRYFSEDMSPWVIGFDIGSWTGAVADVLLDLFHPPSTQQIR